MLSPVTKLKLNKKSIIDYQNNNKCLKTSNVFIKRDAKCNSRIIR